MGRPKKYGTKEERVNARKAASARYYSLNKEEKNKTDMLRYYQKKVIELSLLVSSSLENQQSYGYDMKHIAVTESFIDTSSFQLTAFSSPIYIEGIAPMESINITLNTNESFVTESIIQNFELINLSYVDKPTDELCKINISSSCQEAAQENMNKEVIDLILTSSVDNSPSLFTIDYLLSSSADLVNNWSTETSSLNSLLNILPVESIDSLSSFQEAVLENMATYIRTQSLAPGDLL